MSDWLSSYFFAVGDLSSTWFIICGVTTTLQYSLISVFCGLIIGSFLAICKTTNNLPLQYFANIYTSIFRGTPLLIQLSIIYFAIPQILEIKVSIFAAGILAFSLNSGAYVSEIIRAGINAIDKGQFEAAKALGCNYKMTMRDIILPQAIRKILPSLINELVNVVKESALISILGEMDLMRRAQMVAAEEYTYFEPMLIAAATYYIIVFTLTKIAQIVEKRLAL